MNTLGETPNTDTTNPFHRYLALSWSVIPLQVRGKLPESRLLPQIQDEADPEKRKRSWKPYQSTRATETEITKWWRSGAQNVGIVTGAISGLIVLDLDTEEAIADAQERGLPKTPTASTGKGLHVYFRYPDKAIGNKANFADIQGFDLRGDGGYVVAPPSIHPSGRAYEWQIAPEDAALAEMPTWLQRLLFVESIVEQGFEQRDEGLTGEIVPPAPTDLPVIAIQERIEAELADLRLTKTGGRNDRLNRVAFTLGQLIGAGLADELEIQPRLEAIGLEIGLPQWEVRATIASGLQAGKRQPRTWVEGSGFKVNGLNQSTTDIERKREDQTAALIRFGLQATLFHSPTGEMYARYQSERRQETALISHPKSPFRLWLERQFYQEFGITPSQTALLQALSHLEQVAYYEGETRQVFTRLGYVGETIYLSIGDEQGQVLEIDREGWRLVTDAPVVFRHTRNAEPLPIPVQEGSIEALRPLLNLPNETTWKLCVGWIVGALNPRGPYAHIAPSGEQGSGKSSLLRILRAFVDPAKAEENTEPRNVDDFMVTCLNNHIVSYDNLAGISDWFSDALCRLATGAGLTKRMLYSDFDEVVIDAARPAILNGITGIVTRPDLLERTITFELPRITAEQRLPARHFQQVLAEIAPGVFGALLDAVVIALHRLDTMQLPRLPRMADFVLWVEAAAPALGWAEGEFLSAYEQNVQTKEEQVLEADEVAETMVAWGQYKLRHVGEEHAITMKQLLSELSALRLAGNDPAVLTETGVGGRLPPEWPDSARGLLARLARARPLLRTLGIEYERGSRNNRGQLYVIRRIEMTPIV